MPYCVFPGRGLLEENQAPEEYSSRRGDKPTSLVMQMSPIPAAARSLLGSQGRCPWGCSYSHSVAIRVSLFRCCASKLLQCLEIGSRRLKKDLLGMVWSHLPLKSRLWLCLDVGAPSMSPVSPEQGVRGSGVLWLPCGCAA